MKKLLIHFGYPKTATTTLQEELFVRLHDIGEINYLGRTIKSTHTRYGTSSFGGIDWVFKLRKYLILNESLDDVNEVLKSDILNVISDEDLSFHDFFHFAQFGFMGNHYDFPKKLKIVIGDQVEVSLMVSLRNQGDLIHSCYVQKYRYLRRYLGDLSFDDFIQNKTGHLDRTVDDHLNIFNFDAFIKHWKSIFNAEVKILLFEDFLHDKNFFLSQLGKCLNLENIDLNSLIGVKHFRKRDKTDAYIKSSYQSLTVVSQLISKLFGSIDFERILERRYHMRSSFLLNLEKRIFIRKTIVQLPRITKTQKDKIKEYFNSSNQELAKNYHIDESKMIRYGYINKEFGTNENT